MITPAAGLNLYMAADLAGMSLGQVTRAALPWIFVLVAVLLLITYIPWLSLFLVHLHY